MSAAQKLLDWMERRSDLLSPIVIKEVRQVVRGREFNYSFGAALVGGLAVAFFGAADALSGSGTTGSWTFIALTGCLAFFGLAVVPLAAFSALRNERMEQTLELITLTALTPRRVIVGKLLAQAVKLSTLFAAMAPFIAMSFLLGGIDFVTILVSLGVLFIWSVWACSLCLFLSTLLKTRAMSGLVFGFVGILMFILLVFGRGLFFVAGFGGTFSFYAGPSGSSYWWGLAVTISVCAVTMVNLVLLAENRLSLETENRVTTLRLGFLAQFLLIVAWTLSSIGQSAPIRSNMVQALGTLGGLHLAVVAMFAVTEDLVVPLRERLLRKTRSRWRWFRAMFLPGGGRAAIYILAQMVLMLGVGWLLGASAKQLRWMSATCGYICFFTGVPALVFRLRNPARAQSFHLRVAVLVLLPAAMVLPDVIHYVLWQPPALTLSFGARHLVNPLRTLANWTLVESRYWFAIPLVFGLTGLVAYLALMALGVSVMAEPDASEQRHTAAAATESGSADVIY